jgi:5-methylcytosine-specific restriction endonuclease McrA
MKRIAGSGLAGLVIGAALMFGGMPSEPLQQTPSADVGEHAKPRSSHWPAARAEHLKRFPVCEVCSGKTQLEVHHVQSFHEHPERELDPDNMITLCASPSCKSHLTIGHLGNYKQNNPDVREDSSLLKKRRADVLKRKP